jgi:4-hydroxybenzoate polyprenyltransferase
MTAPPVRSGPPDKRLLIVDGHGSHETDEFMTACFLNNIHLLFLPPHSSHVLQPLDLAIFSPLKRAYRKHLGILALKTNATWVGKKNFISCYQKARKEALTAANIKSGWQATGLWPLHLSKPLMSRLLLENANGDNQIAPGTATPTTPMDWTAETSEMVIFTPKKTDELKRQLVEYQRLGSHVRSTRRHLFNKITKGFESQQGLLAIQSQKIEALEKQLADSQKPKRRKVQLDPNVKFASIEEIIAAANGDESSQSSSSESDDSGDQEDMQECIVVQNSVVVDDDD